MKQISIFLIFLFLFLMNPNQAQAWENSFGVFSSQSISQLYSNTDTAPRILDPKTPYELFALRFENPKVESNRPVQARLPIVRPEKPKKSEPLTPEYLNEAFQLYSAQYGVDKEVLTKIADCESHFNPGVQSKNGIYGGMYQYSASTWASTRNAMGLNPDPSGRFDAQEAIKTTAFKISQGGIGAWPECSR